MASPPPDAPSMQLEARCKALLESTLEEYAVDGTATRMAETFSRALLQAADELFGIGAGEATSLAEATSTTRKRPRESV